MTARARTKRAHRASSKSAHSVYTNGNSRKGKPPRERPKRLHRKLLAIRKKLGASQTEMAKLLKLKKAYTVISAYEHGTREPNLITLLRYARIAKVSVESLIDDELDLP